MILIETTTSYSCRGWEGNECEVFEYDGTLTQYVNEALGFIPEGGSEGSGYNYEGDESSTSFRRFHPTRRYVEMLMKYVRD